MLFPLDEDHPTIRLYQFFAKIISSLIVITTTLISRFSFGTIDCHVSTINLSLMRTLLQSNSLPNSLIKSFMKKLLLSGIIVFLLASCNSSETKTAAKDTSVVAKVMIPESGCYASYSNKDTILLKIEVFPNVVTGVLKYQIEGKDSNEGTIDGKLNGDTLFANYTFSSEGKSSIREVAFLIREGEVTEGFGELKEESGAMMFKDRSVVNFSKGIKFTKIDCVANDEKFRLKMN